MLDANATVEWTPPQYKKRMDDWLRNMGDWNISRKRYFGLPLPFYPCGCGDAERDRLARRARGARDRGPRRAAGAAPALDRRGSDPLRGVRRRGRAGSRRWATPGSTLASSLSRRSAGRTQSGSSTATGRRAAEGLTGADLPDHDYWEQWFPADWISEMREQIRLWFYSHLFMSMTLIGRLAVPRGADLREGERRARAANAQIGGEHDRGARGARPHGRGCDALALLRAAAAAEHQLRLRPGRRGEAPAADALELGRLPRHLREHRRLRARSGGRSRRRSSRSTAGSSRARASSRAKPRPPTSASRRPS